MLHRCDNVEEFWIVTRYRSGIVRAQRCRAPHNGTVYEHVPDSSAHDPDFMAQLTGMSFRPHAFVKGSRYQPYASAFAAERAADAANQQAIQFHTRCAQRHLDFVARLQRHRDCPTNRPD